MSLRRLLRRLDIRLSLVALGVLLLAGTAIFEIIRHYAIEASEESWQRQNIALARHIAERLPAPLLTAEGAVDRGQVARLARDLGVLNPDIDTYVLDPDGRVLAHTLGPGIPVAERIELGAARDLVARRILRPRLPVRGPDPRRAGRRNVVSVTAIESDTEMQGYLYVVLDRIGREDAISTIASTTITDMLWGIGIVIAFAAFVLASVLRSALQPLRRLAEGLDEFRGTARGIESQQVPPAPPGGDDIALVTEATARMKDRIAQQFAVLARNEHQHRTLIAGITHDLQTPLASIAGYAESLLLDTTELDCEARQAYFATILSHTRLLSRRLSDLFELAGLQAGSVPFRPESFCLAELVHDVVAGYRLDADNVQVGIDVATESLRPAPVWADIGLIERALRNLIDNSLKHTAAGGTVTIALAQAPLRAVAVTVADTGRGFSAGAMAVLDCDDVVILKGVDGQPRPRTGLGLVITRSIASLHGGTLDVVSRAGAGSRVRFLIGATPLAARPPDGCETLG